MPLILDYNINGRIAGRNGNRDDYACPHGLFQCNIVDRYIALAVYGDTEWLALCKVIGDLPWTKDKKFASFESRKANEDELERLVLAWTLDQNDEELMHRLQAVGIGAGMVMSPQDFLEKNEHIKAREFYKEINHPEIGVIHVPRQPCVLSKTPCDVRRAPLMGEHTDYVLKEFLHISDEEIAELVVEEVLY